VGRVHSRNIVKRRAVLLFLAIAAFSQQPDTVFRVNVSLVRILATVKNTAGDPVGNMKKDDFEVYDNGVRQEIALFEHHTEQPLSIALLIDTSASTAIDMKYEIESVERFLGALFNEGNPADSISLFSFNYETTQHTGFTRRPSTVKLELAKLRSVGGTSLYDAIHYASRELENREGRHVLVVVTDGGDTTSVLKFEQALEAAQRADAVIYPVLVMPIKNDAGRNIGGENALTLFAQRTGGHVFAPTLGEALDQAFTEILRDLRTQYLIGFYPKGVPAGKDPFHRLEVRMPRGDLRVSARSGYYEESDTAKGWRKVR
jgi:Ca-activated chloride channel family protein